MGKEGSAYGKGFMIRILVLLGVMAAVVGGYYYDKEVLVPGAEKKMLEVQDLANKRGADGKRINREKVHELIGRWASRSSRKYTQEPPEDMVDDKEFMAKFKPKTFDIETYNFRRIVPGLASRLVEFAYLDDVVVFSQSSIAISEDQLNTGFEDGNRIQGAPSDRGGGGGPRPPRGGGGGRPTGDNAGADSDSNDADSNDADSDDADSDDADTENTTEKDSDKKDDDN